MKRLRIALAGLALLSAPIFAQTKHLPSRVAMEAAGAWSSINTYSTGDVVTVSGVYYMSVAPNNTNHAPGSSPTYWSQLATGTGGSGASVNFPAGLLYGDNSTSAPRVANSAQVQSVIGANVYDASGAAAAAITAAEAYAANASNLSSGIVPAARLPLGTNSSAGALKPDGTTCTANAGTLTCNGSGGAAGLSGGTQGDMVSAGTDGTSIIDNPHIHDDGIYLNLGLPTKYTDTTKNSQDTWTTGTTGDSTCATSVPAGSFVECIKNGRKQISYSSGVWETELSQSTLTAGNGIIVTPTANGVQISAGSTVATTTGTTATATTDYSFNGGTSVTYTLPAASAGVTKCFRNLTGVTGTITLQTSGSGQLIDNAGAATASGGYVASGGALGDSACVLGVDSTHWILYPQSGTWSTH